MNMASFRKFIFISLTVGTAYSGFVSVHSKTEKVGQYGQQITVDCVIQPRQEAADAEIRVVNWKKLGDNKPLLYFNRGEYKVHEKRYSFAERSWNNKNRNVSLLINNAAVEDEGVYTCMVVTDSGDGSNTTRLKIRAKYSRPTVKSTPEKITRNTDAVLTCTSEGGYPQGQLRWFDKDGAEWTKSAKMEAVQTDSDLFRLSSNLTLLRASIFSKYTCVVFNSSGVKEEEFPFEINMHERQGQGQGKEMNSASKVVAPVLVIGSLIVGLLILLVIRRRRNRQARRQSALPLMDESVPTREPFNAMEDGHPEPEEEDGGSSSEDAA